MSNKYLSILNMYKNYKVYKNYIILNKYFFPINFKDILNISNSLRLSKQLNLRENIVGKPLYYTTYITESRKKKFIFFKWLTIILYILIFPLFINSIMNIGSYDNIYLEIGNLFGGTLVYFFIYSFIASISLNIDFDEDILFNFKRFKQLYTKNFIKLIFPFNYFDYNRYEIYFFLCEYGIFVYTPIGRVEETEIISDYILYKDIIINGNYKKTAIGLLNKKYQKVIQEFAKNKDSHEI